MLRIAQKAQSFWRKPWPYIFVAFALLPILVISAYYASAEEAVVDWMSGEPQAAVNTERGGADPSNCTKQTVTVNDGRDTKEEVCVYQGSLYQYAFSNTRFGPHTGGFVIRFPSDSKMYLVSNLPKYAEMYAHSAKSEHLFYRAEPTGYNTTAVRVVKNFKAQLNRDTTLGNGVSFLTYRVDGAEPVMLHDEGSLVASSGIGISENGQWFVMQTPRHGYVLVDTADFSYNLFSMRIFRYGTAADPVNEFAVTNDGKYIASTGRNVESEIYEVNSSCGIREPVLKVDLDYYRTKEALMCGRINLSGAIHQALGESPYIVSNPEFNYDGGELELLTEPYPREGVPYARKWVRLTANGYSPMRLEYLALGDSYSSGEGDTERDQLGYKYYRNWTDISANLVVGQPEEKCHISTRSYPYLLARSMDLALDSPKQWDTVACSGATIGDIAEPNGDYIGQGGRLAGFNKQLLQEQALNEFIPGRVQQIEFVKKYKPKVITLTIGGNDVGFASRLQSCIEFGLCDVASEQGRIVFGREILDMYEEYGKLINDLASVSNGQSKIFVFGYPQFINGSHGAQCDLNTGLLEVKEREFIEKSVGYLNSVIKQAARSEGVKYIDIENSLEGHRLCDDGDKYVGAIGIPGDRQEYFHPNARGHQLINADVWGERNLDGVGLLDYEICPLEDTLRCPSQEYSKESIIPPAYFVSDELYGRTKYKTVIKSDIRKGEYVDISVGPYNYGVNEPVNISIYSDPVHIGTFATDHEGSLDARIQVPEDLSAGFHTIKLSGKTYSGEQITYEQIILVEGSDPMDVDEDGVLDTNDACLFVPVANLDEDGDGLDDACDSEITESPQMYRARMGNQGRMYNGHPEKTNYIYIERNVNQSDKTGITGDADPDGDGWAVVGVSMGKPFSDGAMLDTGPIANFEIKGEGTTGSPYVPYVYIRSGHGCLGYTPKSLKKVLPDADRHIRRSGVGVAQADNASVSACRTESPEADVDQNGIADNIQPIYDARQGDPARGEDPSRIYLYRSFHAAEAQLGISDYSPTGTSVSETAEEMSQPIQAWNLLATTKVDKPLMYNKLMLINSDDESLVPVVLVTNPSARKHTCQAYRPNHIKVIRPQTQETRKLTKAQALPVGVNCE